MRQRARSSGRLALPSPMSYISPPDELRQLVETPDLNAFQNFRARALAEGQAAQASIGAEIDQLRAMTDGIDVLRLLGALHMFDVRLRLVLSGPETFGFDAMLEFFAGLITSCPETEVIEHIGERFDPQLVWDVERKLRTIANRQMSIDMAEGFRQPSSSPIDSAIALLIIERHFDRMSGFDPHLRRIAAGVRHR